MQKNRLRTALVFSALLLRFIATLSATLSAIYTPDVPIQLKMSPGVFTHPTVFGTRLGRLEITSTQPLYNPTILVTGLGGGYNVVVVGPYRTWSGHPYTDFDINMNILAVSYPNGLGESVYIRAVKDKQPLLGGWSGMVTTANPFIVDIYLVNSNDRGGTTDPSQPSNLNTMDADFKLDSLYAFKYPPFAPHFTVGVTDSINQGPYVFPEAGEPTQGQFIPINGNVGQGTTPVVDPSGVSTDPDDDSSGFWYGDIIPDPEPVQFFFSFLANTVSFDLNDAYGAKRKEINTANMEVLNGETGQTYKQKITFTDSGDATNFQLKPTSGPGNTIDFSLFWGTSNNLVPYGVPIDWEGLIPGINAKQLWIGDINENTIASLVSGIYIDTIFVNITAAD